MPHIESLPVKITELRFFKTSAAVLLPTARLKVAVPIPNQSLVEHENQTYELHKCVLRHFLKLFRLKLRETGFAESRMKSTTPAILSVTSQCEMQWATIYNGAKEA